MKLNINLLNNKEEWQKANIALPTFNHKEVTLKTKQAPTWIHFGAGNIFRAFPAAVQQQLLNAGIEEKGIIVAEGYDYEIIDTVFDAYDNLTMLVTLKADGTIEKTIIASMVEALKVDSQNEKDFSRLKEIFSNPSLQMASFTITEKGYSLNYSNGDFYPDVINDFEQGPKAPKSYIGKLVSLCYERYISGKYPLALVSMDNCSHNGTKLYQAVRAFAEKWEVNQLVEKGFLAYIENPDYISFPWSMIDKITPRPDESVKAMLREVGFEDVEGVVTSKNTYVAPFVNAEEAQYLVIEDKFPNGRPKLDQGGIIFTERETVDKVEKMKVCTCLNPLHTALAIYGCLLSYDKISEEMKDAELRRLVEIIGYEEGLPVVVNPGIIDPRSFIDEVLNIRVPNPFMPDTPQRIATDTSQKLSIRFGETIKAYAKSDRLDVKNLKLIPLVLAGWCRYLLGVDDSGKSFELSPDPMLDVVRPYLNGITLGQTGPFAEALKPIFSNEKIFGVNLYEVGLGEVVENYFTELVSGPGAVRETLKKYI
ncbi:mannitol dehydrogenase family protein [Cellulosilyticum sp. I15G10I2]|uniref:mannitol dehydrogenase family protein n=1 Tax=Cellulosilyticum sp. I15G10I2 TaxID=1892843 RepID=UPI00085CD84E|nr:mannitol dehydrogenase family protein [Cellulosilyticum sp. I15G10I2]